MHKHSGPFVPSVRTILDSAEDLDRRLTYAEAADYIAISEMTLRRLVKAGEVAAIRFGRNVRFDIRDLRRFLDTRRA